jgi:hypothetical protein
MFHDSAQAVFFGVNRSFSFLMFTERLFRSVTNSFQSWRFTSLISSSISRMRVFILLIAFSFWLMALKFKVKIRHSFKPFKRGACDFVPDPIVIDVYPLTFKKEDGANIDALKKNFK